MLPSSLIKDDYIRNLFIASILTFCAFFMVKTLKKIILGFVLQTSNKGVSVELVKNYELSRDTNMLEYSYAIQMAKDSARIQSDVTDIVLGPSLFQEMKLFPQSIMNDMKPTYKFYPDHRSIAIRLEGTRYGQIINAILMKNIEMVLQDREILIDQTLSLNVQTQYFSDSEIIHINDVHTFIAGTLADVETLFCYGELTRNNSKLNDAINNLILSPNSFSESSIKELYKLRKLRNMLKIKRSHDYLCDLIKKEIIASSKKESILSKNNILELIVQNETLLEESLESINFGFMSFVTCSIKYMWHQISNLIIDISMNEHTYKKLIHEQKYLIKKYGNIFTRKILDKMKYLDAAFLESMRLSGAGECLRMSEKDIFLSNGSKVQKSSVVKLSKFLYGNAINVHPPNPYGFWPERHLLTSNNLSKVSDKNVAWGVGWKTCPYYMYASLSMKLFAAIFFRKYKILFDRNNTAPQHQGYIFGEVAFHNKSDLNIKICDILDGGFDD
ncbi:hypothetical protein BB560_003034 [Smittium megazygosporum]|uniref:Cytochrome P450 n=1 Tax=Smittium megazygosporum TaxID=133381 RepID=A0A2T9ZD43_9FUNG|nr:hypothetical protein BB560_003034 [Smittium megazygosporum]